MDRKPHRALQAAHNLVAFVTAAIQVARQRRAELEEKLQQAPSSLRESTKEWLIEVERWLGKAGSLMTSALEHAREVGREVARVERGLADTAEGVAQHAQRLEQMRYRVIDDFLQHTSREQLARAEQQQTELLSVDEEQADTEEVVEEFEEQLADFNEILEGGQEPDRQSGHNIRHTNN